MIPAQLLKPRRLLRTIERMPCLISQGNEKLGMRPAHRIEVTGVGKLLQGVLADGRKHPESRLTIGLLPLPHEVLFYERLQPAYQIIFLQAEVLHEVHCGIEGKAPNEH